MLFKTVLGNLGRNVFCHSTMLGGLHLISVLQIFSLGKLTNHIEKLIEPCPKFKGAVWNEKRREPWSQIRIYI